MNLEIYSPFRGRRAELPLFLVRVAAGFPSPADDYMEKRLDLNEHLIRHPSSTFFMRVAGESMKGACILPGDILVVDCSLAPVDGDVVVAVLGGEFTVKRISLKGKRCLLLPENEEFPPLEMGEEEECEVWGVVTGVVHSFR